MAGKGLRLGNGLTRLWVGCSAEGPAPGPAVQLPRAVPAEPAGASQGG